MPERILPHFSLGVGLALDTDQTVCPAAAMIIDAAIFAWQFGACRRDDEGNEASGIKQNIGTVLALSSSESRNGLAVIRRVDHGLLFAAPRRRQQEINRYSSILS